MRQQMIAPCGMNCETCLAHLREKNICAGCWGTNGYKSNSCINCSIRNCDFLDKTASKFCYECTKFPCARLKQLDKRYRAKYAVSLIENLQIISKQGLERFEKMAYETWKCNTCGGTICVHTGYCLKCRENSNEPSTEASLPATCQQGQLHPF